MTTPTAFRPPAAAAGGFVPPAAGPVIADRIARIRGRIAENRYPVDGLALAFELVRREAGSATAETGNSVARLLAAAVDQLDAFSGLLLQLEFVEQLAIDEVAVTLGASIEDIRALRRSALFHLKALLDQA